MPLLSTLARRLLTTMASGEVTPAGVFSMAFVTVPDTETAKKLAGGLVSKKLAACVNIIPQITSVYEWEGKINEDTELLLMIKTRTSRMDDISQYVRENHPYDCPEVISSPIDKGNPQYLKWIGEIVPEKTGK
ncbi:protein CutA homolog isoform X2 [Liolophura sinensis]